MIHSDFRDPRPIYIQIAEDFRKQIASGILQKDDKLPSVRELAAELAINPNTIQRAYRELESQGMIVTLPGKGCFVNGCTEDHFEEWQALDKAVCRLLDAGVTKQALLEHLIQGGYAHASVE